MMFKPLPVLTAFTAVSLAILMWLGNWQYGRYSEKIAREAAGTPEWETSLIADLGVPSFSVRTVLGGKPVWKIILPISAELSPGTLYAVVELVESNDPPMSKQAAATPLIGQLVEGIYTMPNGPGSFTIAPDIDAMTWYAFDGDQLSTVFGYPPPADKPLFEPAQLKYTDANGMAKLIQNPYANFYQGDPLPPQRHFGYAITWWGLAIALFVIYFVFHHSQGRLRFRKTS